MPPWLVATVIMYHSPSYRLDLNSAPWGDQAMTGLLVSRSRCTSALRAVTRIFHSLAGSWLQSAAARVRMTAAATMTDRFMMDSFRFTLQMSFRASM